MPTGEFLLNNATVGTFIRNGVIFGVGSSLKETVLWENAHPDTALQAQTVTLSDDINNYDYISVKYNFSNSNSNISGTNIVSVDDFKKSVYATGNYLPFGTAMRTTNSIYTRFCYYSSDTSVYFSSAILNNSSGSSNNYAIPVNVIGIKESIGGG